MSNFFQGKTALVTGASKGIGKYIAIRLLEEGCKVVFLSRNPFALDKIFKGIEKYNNMFFTVNGDVTKQNHLNDIYLQFKNISKKIDFLVCNVGNGRSVKPGSENYEEWLKMFHSNFFSTTNIIERFKNDLVKSKGSIVCISSICGVEVIDGAPITYSVAKAALNSYVKSVAKVFGKLNVRINAIAPGNILFEGSVWETQLKFNHDKVIENLAKNVPLNKFGKPEDIASLTKWLLSEEASFVTGSIFISDGGQTR